MADIYSKRTETGAQSVTHATGATTIAYELNHTGTPALADVYHVAKIPAGATITDIKIALVKNAYEYINDDGTEVAKDTATTGAAHFAIGVLGTGNAALFRAGAALTGAAAQVVIGLPKTFAEATEIILTGSNAAIAGGKTIGVSVTYTTEFVER